MKKNPATDLLDALRATVVPAVVPPGFYSLRELEAKTGESRSILSKKIATLKAECRMFRVRSGQRTMAVMHYRLSA